MKPIDKEQCIDTMLCRLAQGDTLSEICEDAGMPCTTTATNWLLCNEYRHTYYTFKLIGVHNLVAQAQRIADGKDPLPESAFEGLNANQRAHQKVYRDSVRVQALLWKAGTILSHIPEHYLCQWSGKSGEIKGSLLELLKRGTHQ